METSEKISITVETEIRASIDNVWKYWTEPSHITKWNFASDDWHCPSASNDLKVDGKFSFTMSAKDGSFSFDFGGVYSSIQEYKLIEYVLGDGRKTKITFGTINNLTKVVEIFEAETSNPIDLQRAGWQSILNNFKNYVEAN